MSTTTPEPWIIDLDPQFIDRCCCGHDSIDHVRVFYSDFPCVVCACIDHEPVLPDAATIADITTIFANLTT